MASRDSAFLWETEALRSTPPGRGPASRHDQRAGSRGGTWLTLREASEITGVPSSTLRKWARHDNIPSYLESTPEGDLRMVSLDGIRMRAGELGRAIDSPEPESPAPAPPRMEEVEVDLTSLEHTESQRTVDETSVPEGSMIVPLDAWNKMLNQLGNLHEAGQQLAEARERAAKAETEAMFLKERLAELRDELDRSREEPPTPHRETPPEAEGETPEPTTVAGYTSAMARHLRGRWMKWRQRR